MTTRHHPRRPKAPALAVPLTLALALALAGCSGDSDPAPTDRQTTSETTASTAPQADANAPAPTSSIPAGGVVVRVSGGATGRYPVGTNFADGAIITLAEGESLVVLNADGTRTLAGPGSFLAGTGLAATSEAAARGETLSRVASAAGADAGRSSAAASRMPARPVDTSPAGRIDTAARYAAALFDAEGRSAAAATRRQTQPQTRPPGLSDLPYGPALWTFALGSSGTHCLPALNDIVFARRGGGEALPISVTPASGAPRSLTIRAGASTAGWVGPWLSAGTPYRIAVDGGPVSEARFVAIGTPPADPAGLARLLAERGCTRQVQRLARIMGASGIARDDIAIPGRPASRPTPDSGRPTAISADPIRSDVAPPRPDGPRPDGPRPDGPRPDPRITVDPRVIIGPEPRPKLRADPAEPATPVRPRLRAPVQADAAPPPPDR